MMPVMNGYEAARMIRSMDREDAKVIPIIAMTANAFTEDKLRTKEAGMNELLWSSFFVTLVAKKIVLINLCCRPCFIWGSITIITVWTNMIIINVCKFFYLLIECFLCCKLIQICAFILQRIMKAYLSL